MVAEGTEAVARATALTIGPKWEAGWIKNPYLRNGCEIIACQIKAMIGGQKIRIKPKIGGYLPAYRGANLQWQFHEVVVKDGRVYDQFTGHLGLSIKEYKELWDYAKFIDFGF